MLSGGTVGPRLRLTLGLLTCCVVFGGIPVEGAREDMVVLNGDDDKEEGNGR